MRKAIVALLVALSFGLSGCSDSVEAQDARKKLADAANAVAKWTKSEWSKFASSSGERLTKLTDDLSGLGSKAKEKLGPVWQSLQDKAQAAKSKIQSLGGKSKEAWGAAKDDLDKAIQSLEQALQDAKQKLGK